MKKIISIIIITAMLLASVIAMIPASAATVTEFNLMGNSNATEQLNGRGNVFYYDYYKYLSLLGDNFPVEDAGKRDYMIRYPNGATGSSSVCDGVKTSGGVNQTDVSADGAQTIGNDGYNAIFGYSFKESVFADAVKLYIPSNTSITAIDIYGAIGDKNNGVYANEAKNNAVLLASFTNVKDTPTTSVQDENSSPADVIVIESELFQATKLDYIYIAVKSSDTFKIFEIELNGILAKNAQDFSTLRDQFLRYNDLIEENYSQSSWAKLETAFTNAEKVNKNASSTATEISSAATALRNAIDGLKPPAADISALKSYVSEKESLTKGNYTDNTWNAFQQALNAAKQIVTKVENEEDVSQDDVDNALFNLDTAFNSLVTLASKTALLAQLARTEGLNASDYTAKTWNALTTAIAKANTIKNDPDATQDEVDTTTAALKKAIDGLESPANKTALLAQLARLEALNKDDYTEKTWDELASPEAKAIALKNDENATQADVDAAAVALKAAIDGLKKHGNKDMLETAISSAKALDKSNYKASTLAWNILERAIEDGEKIIADKNATSEDVEKAISELSKAIENLGEPLNGDSADKEDDKKADTKETEATPKETQDNASAQDSTQTETTAPRRSSKGCKSSVGATAALLGIVATFGTALVVKKKD